MLQYGFVTIFVSAFPLAPLFALIVNIVELRRDAKKFLKKYRRPIPIRARNIGVWFNIMGVLGRISVVSNVSILNTTVIQMLIQIPFIVKIHDTCPGLIYLIYTTWHIEPRDRCHTPAVENQLAKPLHISSRLL